MATHKQIKAIQTNKQNTNYRLNNKKNKLGPTGLYELVLQ